MKKKFPKRLLSWLLTCTMVFNLSATAFAADTDADAAANAVVENETTAAQTTDADASNNEGEALRKVQQQV